MKETKFPTLLINMGLRIGFFKVVAETLDCKGMGSVLFSS
jgi:hypothetical protein